MTLLTFNRKYVVQSIKSVNTTSGLLQDDTEAIQVITLSKSQTVLVVYQANNNFGSAENGNRGTKNSISIDGSDVASSSDTPTGNNYPCRNTTFWIGTLTTGSHAIKGRFCSNLSGNISTIDNRILLIYILNGTEFQYIDNTTSQSTTSQVFIDDTNASVTFTPSSNCVALYMYNCSGVDVDAYGKKAGINVSGSDFSQAEKSMVGSGGVSTFYDSVFTVYSNTLTNIATTVIGRFASGSGSSVTVSSRQLGVLLFDNSTLMDIITSDNQVSTTSNSLVNDNQATINRTTTDTRELLVVAMGTKRKGTFSSVTGECYGIGVDSVNRQVSRGSPGQASSNTDSASTVFAMTIAVGVHTVQGIFSNNNDLNSAKIDSRRIVALWLVPGLSVGTSNKILYRKYPSQGGGVGMHHPYVRPT